MNLTILEGLYYFVTILVSVGFLRSLFSILIISNNLEIMLISNVQKNILKVWYFIKFFFALIYIYIELGSIITTIKFGFSIMDFITYFTILFFCDYTYLSLFENTAFLQLYSNLIKKIKSARYFIILFISFLLTILTYYLEEIIDYRAISIMQLVLIIAFISYCNEEKNIIIKGKYLKIDFGVTFIFTPIIMKTLLLFSNKSIFNTKALEAFLRKFELSDLPNQIYNIYYKIYSSKALIVICALSVLLSLYFVNNKFNLPSLFSQVFFPYFSRIF